MSRILTSSVLLAAALVIAGCGGSSTDSTPHPGIPSVASLKGNYVFEEQVYTNFSASSATAPVTRSGRFASANVWNHVASLPHRAQAMAALQHNAQARSLRSAAMTRSKAGAKSNAAQPDQGEGGNSTYTAWGASIGSLTFDGDGHITGGEIDFNEPFATGSYTDTISSGKYTVSSDQIGSISATASNGDEYDFQITLQGTAVATGGAATGAQLLEGNIDEFGDVQIGTGQLLPQDSTTASLNGSYAFGLRGETCYGCAQTTAGDIYAAGVLVADGSGNFTSAGQADVSTEFNTDNLVGVTGTYTTPDANGRITATLAETNYNSGALPSGYAIYVANSSTVFILATDQSAANEPAAYLFGQMGLQSGSFTNTSLIGNYVTAETTEDLANESVYPDTYSDTYLALLTATGGTLNGTGDINAAGTVSSSVPFPYGTYTVAANGRVTLTGTTPSGAAAPVFWLQNSSTGYGIDQLNGVATQEPGLIYLYQQAGSGFSTSSLNGTFALGNLAAATSNVGLDVNGNEIGPGLLNGVLTSDGNGNLSGSGSIVYINGDGGDGPLTGTYTVDSTGRGTITGSSNGLFGNEVFYIAGSGVALSMDVTPGNSAPAIQIIHQ
jgi:hypothetical protein